MELKELNDDDLADELEKRGYFVSAPGYDIYDHFSTDELEDELHSRTGRRFGIEIEDAIKLLEDKGYYVSDNDYEVFDELITNIYYDALSLSSRSIHEGSQ